MFLCSRAVVTTAREMTLKLSEHDAFKQQREGSAGLLGKLIFKFLNGLAEFGVCFLIIFFQFRP